MRTFLLLELFLSYGENPQQTLVSDFPYFEHLHISNDIFLPLDVFSLFISKE